MRVPAPLVGAIGSSEIKLSLYEARRRNARLKASYLAFHIRGFFAYLHRAMQNLSRAEVTRLVESWRTKMIARDSEVRRLVETGLSSYSLMGYADACEATGDVLADLADKILPTTYLDRDRQPLRGSRLDAAHGQALAFATAPVEADNPECDWQPVINRDQLDSINEVSKRDLVNAWLPQAVVVAVLNNDLTIKRLGMVDGDLALIPENPHFKPIVLKDGDTLEVWGVVEKHHRQPLGGRVHRGRHPPAFDQCFRSICMMLHVGHGLRETVKQRTSVSDVRA